MFFKVSFPNFCAPFLRYVALHLQETAPDLFVSCFFEVVWIIYIHIFSKMIKVKTIQV